ncbi:MAG: DNA-3-methyladenine glycosylase [Solirubrobacteraceae bacterium]|jgi:3-methyladenine DNA glycosylase/8-oxoguanine DNA glycosylase|nr:DNA-3-methyladenine glycosylase [Solirubrobacteraceae bacterium]
MIELSREVVARWPWRLPRYGGPDGLARVSGGALRRLLHLGDEAVVVTVRQPARDRALLHAVAPSREAVEHGIERMRFALGLDDDLRPFYERFRFDPLIGPAVRRDPLRRVRRRPEPFEALTWAITEQLIEFDRAAAIQRRLIARLGRRCARTGLRDAPGPAALAGAAPALLQSCDLAGARAITLIRVSREIAAARVELPAPAAAGRRGDAGLEAVWRRLRAVPGIGQWTMEMLALHGHGRLDVVPAGDLGFLKLVGRLRTGNPYDRATPEEAHEFFERFHPWAGQAGAYLLSPGGLARRMVAAA